MTNREAEEKLKKLWASMNEYDQYKWQETFVMACAALRVTDPDRK